MTQSMGGGEAPILLTKERIERILEARFADGFKSLKDLPQPMALYGMERAAKRIARAIAEGERIAIVGDYDVDGVVSTALMTEFFELVGYPVQSVIPNRFRDGYGVSPTVLERIEADVVITVDNGITAFEAADVCKVKGIDLIITDHHTPGDNLPDAYAIVNPKQSACTFAYPDICGAQVAWFLIGALKQAMGLSIDMGRFLDLLALAIVADVMPLLSINRPLVRKGLEMLSTSTRPAFEVVRAHLGKDRFSAEDVGFGIAPRINSAGRMEDASAALRFLRAKSLEEASEGWLELERLNQMRKAQESETTEAAIAMTDPSDEVVVVAGEGWHEGVVGIVASRLVDRFGKPAIVLSIEGDRAKGSGRSVGEVDLYALLDRSKNWLEGFGGHKMAAGLALRRENIDAFRRHICDQAAALDPKLFLPRERVMGRLPLSEVDWELMALLERFEPYGEANTRPTFLFEALEILEARALGREGEHLRLTVGDGRRVLQAVQFRCEDTSRFKKGQRVRLTGTLHVNEFRGERSIQLLIDKIF